MTTFGERKFQLWEYKVSHGSVLIRSPRRSGEKSNIDIVLVGVEYLALPRHLGQVELSMPTDSEVEELSVALGKPVSRDKVTVFLSGSRRFLTVSSGVQVTESETDIFDSPFDS